MELGLAGRTAIVCGGSSGIGLAVAEALVAEGANVAIFARRREVLEREADRIGALGVQGDLTIPQHLERLVQATIGGPVLRERLWFFLAGRDEASVAEGTYPVTGAPFSTGTENRRYEIKLTGEVHPGHRLQASYVENLNRHLDRAVFPFSIDPRVETPEEVRDRVLEAARYIPPEQLGTTDDCGFSPFCDDTSTTRDTAFAKIRARVLGTALAAETLGGR